MFKTLWFLFIALTVALAISWMLDHNGSLVINWLGYEAKTDILTAILLLLFFAVVIFIFAYAIARIMAIRFYFFSKKSDKKHDKQS